MHMYVCICVYIYVCVYVCMLYIYKDFPGGASGKESASQCRRHKFNPQEDPLEKEMAPHSSILAWKIPWTEEPGGLQSMGSQKCWTQLVTKQQQQIYVYMCVRVYISVCVCVYIQLIHFAVQQKIAQHCKATIFQCKLKRKNTSYQ